MNPISTITNFVLERIHDEPIHKQIPLFRALAELTPDTDSAKIFRIEASELEDAESRQRQIRLIAMARGAYKTSCKRS